MFGLTWDEPVFYQSTRHGAYKEALNELEQGGFIYTCNCSRKSLLERQVVNGIYDQHCLNAQSKPTLPYALRIKLPINALSFQDQIQGDIEQDLIQEVGDFVVLRKDNIAAYHLAVSLDDHEQQITEVLRGYDLLASTPRQIMLQQMLQLNTPNYAHIPVINHADGSKLSKQTFAQDISLSPVKQTLINAFLCLNMHPPEDLIDASIESILNWGIQHWSLANIKQQASILLE
jgi:glutamyl-Q tRNA(Asp) synthetase